MKAWMDERTGAWMDGWEREGAEQEADQERMSRERRGEGGRAGRDAECVALRGPVQRGMLALPDFCSSLPGGSVPGDQSSSGCRTRKAR